MQKTIFVVDDNDANLTAVRQSLGDNYRIFTATSAAKMFELLSKVIPDMILLDLEMPEMKGDAAIVKLKENPEWAKVPVMFLTGWNDEVVIAHCLGLGAVDMISKPFSPLLLLRRIDNYLNTASEKGS